MVVGVRFPLPAPFFKDSAKQEFGLVAVLVAVLPNVAGHTVRNRSIIGVAG
jgi:hypothetical protein